MRLTARFLKVLIVILIYLCIKPVCDQYLFVICVAYYSTYLPVTLRIVLSAKGVIIPDAVQLVMTWIYHSSAAVNGFLYIALHSSVRRELRRYLPRCRRNTVAPAAIQPVGDGGPQRHCGIIADAGAPGAPATAMASFCQHETERLPTTVLMLTPKLVLITNRKSHMSFRLVPNSVTSNYLERRNNPKD